MVAVRLRPCFCLLGNVGGSAASRATWLTLEVPPQSGGMVGVDVNPRGGIGPPQKSETRIEKKCIFAPLFRQDGGQRIFIEKKASFRLSVSVNLDSLNVSTDIGNQAYLLSV